MNAGRIEQLATPREIYDSPATPFVADFIGETNFIRGSRNGAVIAVRPERIRVRREPDPGGAALAGEVITTMVVGPAVQCLVRTDDGQEVLVRQQRSDGSDAFEALAEGDRVFVTWAEDAALVLRDKGGST
jgi:putative spermidine/putrescine transport system ATP-binding protein